MPKDAIELTIERQTTSLAAMIQSVAIPEPPVDSPPIQPALPVPQQPVPQVESAQTPTLENAVPKPEPTPELTSRDFPKVAPVVRKMEQKKLSPKSDPKPDLNKALEPPGGGHHQMRRHQLRFRTKRMSPSPTKHGTNAWRG